MQIYLVIGSSGRYDEYTTWVVCAYRDEAGAAEHATQATKAIERINEQIDDLRERYLYNQDYPDYDNMAGEAARLIVENKWDINIDPYYKTTYHVQEIELYG